MLLIHLLCVTPGGSFLKLTHNYVTGLVKRILLSALAAEIALESYISSYLPEHLHNTKSFYSKQLATC